MKRRTRIHYSPEWSTDIILLLCPLFTILVGIDPFEKAASVNSFTYERKEISRGLVAKISIRAIANISSSIVTLVERYSRFVMLAKISDNKTITVVSALIKQAREIPVELYKTLTWDSGAEMTSHTRFTVATDIHIYFCDPQSPWRRGSNENTNRLLRQYFPK